MDDSSPSLSPDQLLSNASWLRALTISLARDEEAARDLAQDTWLAALSAREPARESVRSWLRAIARNLWARRESRAAGRKGAEGGRARAETMPSAAEVVSHAELLRRVFDEAVGLDEPYRTTVLLRYVEGLTVEELSRRMDVPASTGRTRLSTRSRWPTAGATRCWPRRRLRPRRCRR